MQFPNNTHNAQNKPKSPILSNNIKRPKSPFEKDIQTLADYLETHPQEKSTFEYLFYQIQFEKDNRKNVNILKEKLSQVAHLNANLFAEEVFKISQRSNNLWNLFGWMPATTYTDEMKKLLERLGCRIITPDQKATRDSLELNHVFSPDSTLNIVDKFQPSVKVPIILRPNPLDQNNPYNLQNGDILVFSAPSKNPAISAFSSFLGRLQSISDPTNEQNKHGHRSDVHSGLVKIVYGVPMIVHVRKQLDMRPLLPSQIGDIPIHVFRMKDRELADLFADTAEEIVSHHLGETFFSLTNGIKLMFDVKSQIPDANEALDKEKNYKEIDSRTNAICSQFVIGSLQKAIDISGRKEELIDYMPLIRQKTMTRQMTHFLRTSNMYDTFFIPSLANSTNYNPNHPIQSLLDVDFHLEPENSGYIFLLHILIAILITENENLVHVIRLTKETLKRFGINSKAVDNLVLHIKRYLGYLPEWFDNSVTIMSEEARHKNLDIDRHIFLNAMNIYINNVRKACKLELKPEEEPELLAKGILKMCDDIQQAPNMDVRFKRFNDLVCLVNKITSREAGQTELHTAFETTFANATKIPNILEKGIPYRSPGLARKSTLKAACLLPW